MKIIDAQFVTGVVNEQAVMYDGTPHVAFIGRSNVGKSTAINAILGRRKLVKTGRTPGKTREINFFSVKTDSTNNVYFVDLPGYGYAKVSKTDREKLEKLIRWYITHPASDNKLIVLIIDAKAGLTDFDDLMVHLMIDFNKEFIIAINKIDKINQKSLNKLKLEISAKTENAKTGENIFYISAFKNKNIHLLREEIFKRLNQ